MTIEELEHKHFTIDEGVVNIPISFVDSHTKLSIQFAIEVLESFDEHTQINNKIQELKQFLDAKV